MDLNIRNIPKDVMLKLKVASAQSSMTLRQYVLSKLMDEQTQPIRPSALKVHAPAIKAPPVDQRASYYVPAKYRSKKSE